VTGLMLGDLCAGEAAAAIEEVMGRKPSHAPVPLKGMPDTPEAESEKPEADPWAARARVPCRR
jgi:hypothetical protein